MDDDDESNNIESSDGRVSASASATSSVQIMPDGSIKDDVDDNNKNSKGKNDEIEYNYEAMHRTFSKLPLEEQERMGGIPQLPPGIGTDNAAFDAEQRAEYERRMKEIWDRRQAELRAFEEEHVVELPDILKSIIARIREYLEYPYPQLYKMKNSNEDDDMASVLEELEYQLTDLDMTRDFHTLGGWPVLSSLISDHVHNVDNPVSSHHSNLTAPVLSPQELWQQVYHLQTNAAWAMGTAVKNIEEFAPWAVEEVRIGSMDNNSKNNNNNDGITTTTPLDLLVLQLERSFEKQLHQCK